MTYEKLRKIYNILTVINSREFIQALLIVCPHLKNDDPYIFKQWVDYLDNPIAFLINFTYGEELFNILFGVKK